MSNNKQQTAVDSIIDLCQELLANHYSISHDGVCSEIIRFCQEQAKEMEKEQMKTMYKHAMLSLLNTGHGEDFEQYYNETYNK